jgi:hypothetical protein
MNPGKRVATATHNINDHPSSFPNREQTTGGSLNSRPLSNGNNVMMPIIDHAKQRQKL